MCCKVFRSKMIIIVILTPQLKLLLAASARLYDYCPQTAVKINHRRGSRTLCTSTTVLSKCHNVHKYNIASLLVPGCGTRVWK